MNACAKSSSKRPDPEWVGRTNLVRDWQRIKKEIDLHKWYESEKAGHDIGVDRATVDYLLRYGKKPRRQAD
jgi:hypothetical protein